MDDLLLLKFLSGQCTEDELKQITEWIQKDEANANWLFEIESVWSLKNEREFSNREDVETAYNRLLTQIESSDELPVTALPKANRWSIAVWIPYAAAAVLVCLLSINLYQNFQRKPAGINTIEVPLGQRVALILSDGTRVWLNAASSLSYPTDFSESNRVVTLKGEGYFEVTKKDDRSPFIVHTPGLDVRVLGTAFNLKAYADELTSVKLKEGKVEVSTSSSSQKIIMLPNEQLNYSTSTGMELLKKVDVKNADSWTLGELSFVAESLEDIAKALERKFNINIIIKDDSLKQEQFTCRVEQNTSLTGVLELLKSTRRLNYRYENKQLVIYKY